MCIQFIDKMYTDMIHECLHFPFPRNVGSFIAAVTALVSAIVMYQTRHDTIHGRYVCGLTFLMSLFLYQWLLNFKNYQGINHVKCISNIRDKNPITM